MAVIYGDGVAPEARAFGLEGGLPGKANRLEFELPDGTIIAPRLKQKIEDLPCGTILRQWAGGGGGFGNPHERAVEVVLEDVRNGILSPEEARDTYAVNLETRRREA